MEVVRGRRSRDMMCPSPPPPQPPPAPSSSSTNSHGRMMMIRPTTTFKRVQVVYYLSRNGQLEHPHFMEVTHLSHQNLRLKDVIDRLTVLRGKGMPSLYSWSCKRCYKNGYVWNDLSENDVIYPSEGGGGEGAEYILKGSEVIEGCSGNGAGGEKFQRKIQSKLKSQSQCQSPRVSNRQSELLQPPVVGNSNRSYTGVGDDDEEEEDEDYYEEKMSYTVTPRSRRCNRGISTDEGVVIKSKHHHHHPPTAPAEKCRENFKSPASEFTLEGSPPPPSTTSSNLSDKINININPDNNKNTSKRYDEDDDDGDGGEEIPLATVSRNSMFLQLIACGSSLPFKSKNNINNNLSPPSSSVPKKGHPPPPSRAAVESQKSNNSTDLLLHSKNASVEREHEEEVEEMIKCMSENPRFGNLQAEEKEYFSGSIVEAMTTEERAQIITPSLKKSSSYNEERSSKQMIMVEEEEEEEEEYYERKGEKCMNGKCIPRKRNSTKQSKK